MTEKERADTIRTYEMLLPRKEADVEKTRNAYEAAVSARERVKWELIRLKNIRGDDVNAH